MYVSNVFEHCNVMKLNEPGSINEKSPWTMRIERKERERETLFNEEKVTKVDVSIIKFHIIPNESDDENVERVTPFLHRSPTFMMGRTENEEEEIWF